MTQQLLSEIDGFIVDGFQPGAATADQVKAGLDSLLGNKPGEMIHNVCFAATLPAGNFLIAGIDLRRGGNNFPTEKGALPASVSFFFFHSSRLRFQVRPSLPKCL